MITAGTMAPDFTLNRDGGSVVTLSALPPRPELLAPRRSYRLNPAATIFLRKIRPALPRRVVP